MVVYMLGLMQFVVIAFICYYEFKIKSPAVFMWATLFIMFGVMHLFTSFSGDIIYSDNVLYEASLFVLLFCFFYIFTRFMLIKIINEDRYDILKFDSLQKGCIYESFHFNFLIFILGAVIIIRVFTIIKSAGGLFATSWSSIRQYSASLDYFNSKQVLKTIYYSFSGLAICSILQKRKITTILILALFIIQVIVTRNRIEILPAIVSIISIYIFKTKKLGIRTIIFVCIASIAVIYLVYGFHVFRHYGSLSAFIQDFSFDNFIAKINVYIATDKGELGLRRVFYFFIYNNKFANFGKAHSYIRMLLVFIPTRWSFGIKPPDFAHSMGAAIGMPPGGSTHPTLFGDCYANLGWMGIFLGIFWATYASAADYIILKRQKNNYLILLYSLFAIGNVIIGRGSVYNGFFIIAYGTVVLLIVERLSYLKIFKKQRSNETYLNLSD